MYATPLAPWADGHLDAIDGATRWFYGGTPPAADAEDDAGTAHAAPPPLPLTARAPAATPPRAP